MRVFRSQTQWQTIIKAQQSSGLTVLRMRLGNGTYLRLTFHGSNASMLFGFSAICFKQVAM